MTAQSPAEGISQTGSFTDAVTYRVDCECHSNDHSVDMWIEVNREEDNSYINVNFYVETSTPLINNIWHRFKLVWQMLTTGTVRQEHNLMLRKQAAINFAHTIIDKTEELEKMI